MSALLPDGFVQGRLPHGWRIAARIVYETGVIEITSPDTERFLLNVDVFNLGEYSSTHKPNVGVLGDVCLEGKYTAGVLRYDTTEVPEFWLEVHVKNIMDMIDWRMEWYRTDGDFYKGQAAPKDGNSKYHYWNGDFYEGQWKATAKDGNGKYHYINGDIYEGQWKADVEEGFGIMRYDNGGEYKGNWKAGAQHGDGHYKYANGGTFVPVKHCYGRLIRLIRTRSKKEEADAVVKQTEEKQADVSERGMREGKVVKSETRKSESKAVGKRTWMMSAVDMLRADLEEKDAMAKK